MAAAAATLIGFRPLASRTEQLNRLIWFRNDLRLHDNETLHAALKDKTASVDFIFVYDKAFDRLTPEGAPRVGAFRKKYLAESVIELREKLRALGADLLCVTGDPVKIVPAICRQRDIHELYYSHLSTFNERQQERLIERDVKSFGVHCFPFQTHTLISPNDFTQVDFSRPMSFSKFRGFVEKSWSVRARVAAVQYVGARRERASLNEIAFWEPETYLKVGATGHGFQAEGGETKSLARVEEYFWHGDHLRHYKETRNGLIAINDSSKFSPALALGCVSARHLYAEVRRYERERVSNSSTLWFLYELLWRDHFHFAAERRGRHLFTDQPDPATATASPKWQRENFEKWRRGQTEVDFINAAMNELYLTGWMSNRMRQNTASYLVHDLGVEWQAGARWFETCLIDYDAASNWGNWTYIAGAGAESQPHIFNVHQQAKTYDADSAYVDLWLNEVFEKPD